MACSGSWVTYNSAMRKSLSRRELLWGLAVALLSASRRAASQAKPSKSKQKNSSKPEPTDPITLKAREIVVKQLGVDERQVIPTARFAEDLNADSLDLVELIMAFEEAFDLKIPDKDAAKICTFKEAVDYLKAHAKPPKPN
jgi:acyl carrier protein